MVALDEVEGIAPVEEVEFDGGARGVIAEAAFRGVASEVDAIRGAMGSAVRICC